MSTALYRRYRPEAFDEVIGQEHVTRPLSAAIDAGRINHAFLFSGPRGCGKTTSARILARCLNCAEGPTSNPCGQCPSCQDLANGGPGSLDVVEIDAASHNGVDDARDLRERAVYAPARDRYKVFILDEAHMVTTQGFNALLKLVEEPPAHVKFVFATTEPDKVIQTIRSRTHHYPFRLVPPETLVRYLDDLSGRENVNVGKGVLPLVVRAGGGSVRDTLSVLDQLMAGADDEGVDYSTAVALLGYTDDSLLGDIVDSFSAGDGAGVFRVIDRVVESGHDPRRFVEDLLERFRDLFVISAAEDAAASFLPEVPADRLERLKVQARAFGPAELSRAADLLNVGLTEMTGATSPRLQLELICARILLPGAEDSRRSVVSRVDRLERRIGMSAGGRIPEGAVPAQAGPEPVGAEATGIGAASSAHSRAETVGTDPAGTEEAPGSGAAHGQAPSAVQGTAESATAAQDADPFAGVADAMASARSVLDARPDDKPRGPSAPAEPPRTGQQPDLRAEQVQQAEPQQRPERAEPAGGPPQQRSERAQPAEPPQTRRPVPTGSQAGAPGADQHVHAPQAGAQQAAPPQADASRAAPPQAGAPRADDSPADVPEAHASPEIRQAPGVGAEIDAIRRGWPDVLTRLQQLRKLSYAIVSGNSFPQRFADGVLFLGFSNPGSVQAFRRGPHAQFVSSAVEDSLGIRAEVRVGDENAGPPSAPPAPSGPQPGGPAGQGSPGSDGPGQRTAGPHDHSGPRQVTQEELDSVVGPREADRAPVDHERYWQSGSADQSGAVRSGAPTSQPPSPRGREGRDDAEDDSRTPLTGADAERGSREPSADLHGAATAVAAEQSVSERTSAGEPPAAGPVASETSSSAPAASEPPASAPVASGAAGSEPADSETAGPESAGPHPVGQTQTGAAETAAMRAAESAGASADAEADASAPTAADWSETVQSAQDPWASDPWAPEAGYESWSGTSNQDWSGDSRQAWSGDSTQDDEPVATAAGDRAVDFGAVLVPPPVDIEPSPDDGEYPDEYADPQGDAPPAPVEEGSGDGRRDLTGSDSSADRKPVEDQSPAPRGDLDFLGAYADVDISFTENPGHAQASRTAETAASADSPLGRYANLAQRHSGDVKEAGQPAPPIEEHVPDPVENYTDYDTEGDADIEHDDEYGPGVVERILGGVIIEELNE